MSRLIVGGRRVLIGPLKREDAKNKNCTGCHQRHLLSEYSRSRRFSDGLNRRCKLCCAASRRRSYLKNRARRLAYQKDHYATHKAETAGQESPTERNIGSGSPRISALTSAATEPSCWSTVANIASGTSWSSYTRSFESRNTSTRSAIAATRKQ